MRRTSLLLLAILAIGTAARGEDYDYIVLSQAVSASCISEHLEDPPPGYTIQKNVVTGRYRWARIKSGSIKFSDPRGSAEIAINEAWQCYEQIEEAEAESKNENWKEVE